MDLFNISFEIFHRKVVTSRMHQKNNVLSCFIIFNKRHGFAAFVENYENVVMMINGFDVSIQFLYFK